LMKMAMKCADLGHLTLAWEVHRKWVFRLEDEFFAQGDMEKAKGLPASYLMDRHQQGCSKSQTGFFEFVALPYFRSLVRALPDAQPLLDGMMANYCAWQDIERPPSTGVAGFDPTKSFGSDAFTVTTMASDGSDSLTCAAVDWNDAMCKVDNSCSGDAKKKKSGRTRQRAAKYWASVRCRTPSPEVARGSNCWSA